MVLVSVGQLASVGSSMVDTQAASSLLRAAAPAALLVLRGGAQVGPIKAGPISIDLLLGPRGCVMINAAAGLLYSMSLIGLDPNMPDPTLKYWEQEQTPATRAILQFFALTLVWINSFMLYAMFRRVRSVAQHCTAWRCTPQHVCSTCTARSCFTLYAM